MKRGRLGEAVVPGLIVAYIVAYVVQTYDLPVQTILYPYIVIGLLVVVLIVFGVQQWVAARGARPLAAPSEPSTTADPDGPGPVAVVVAFFTANHRAVGVVVLTFLFPHVVAHLGFFFTSSLYLSALFWLFDTVRRPLMLPLALVISAVLAWLLIGVVRLNFPQFGFAELPWYF